MTDQVRTLTIRQVLDAGSYVTGARDMTTANREMSASTKSLATDFAQVQVRLSSAADPVSRLTRAYDSAGAAQTKFTSDLMALNRALETGGADRASAIYAGMVSRLGMMADGTNLAAQGYTRLGAVVDEVNRSLMQQATAARATAEAARQTDLYAQKAMALRAVIDPIGTSQARLNAEIAEYTVLLNRAEITTMEFAAAQVMARQRHDELVASMNRTPAANDNLGVGGDTREAQYRRQNLGMQLFDIGQTASLGMNPMLILAQQGPQIAQIYAMQGGLNAAMRDFSVILGTVARVAGPLIGILAGVYGAYKILESNSVAASLGVSDATRAMAEQAASVSTLRGQISELTQMQAELNRTIAASAGISTVSIDTIVANTKREFEAKKALLELELVLQESKLRTMQADIAIVGQGMKERVAEQVATDPSRAEREGFADPRINGGIPFVSLTDDISGLQKTMETLDADPAKNQIAKLRAEMTVTELAYEKLLEVLKKPFRIGEEPSAGVPTASSVAALADASTARDNITALRQAAGSRSTIAEQIQARQQLFQTQSDEMEKLKLEASLVGASARERATMTAALQAEQQLRQQGISLLSAEGQAYKANAVTMAQARLEIERSQAAYTSYQQAGSSAIDALTASTGSLQDRLKGAADAMLSWVTQLALANPIKNATFGTSLPTLADLGKPAIPAGISPTSTASMMVTAGSVMINGGVMGGQFPSIPGTSLPGTTTTSGGLLDLIKGPAAANVNGVRPDLMSSGLINSPVASQSVPTGNIEAYIRQAAVTRGIDPNVAVRVAQSEGGLQSWNAQSQVFKNGMQEQSYGPYQLYMGGGLGNRFQQQTGLDPRLANNGPQGVDFALDTASKEGWGAWYGARKAGVSDWQGIGKNPGIDSTTTNSITQSSSALKQFSTTTLSATKDVSGLGDSTTKLGTSLTDSLGKLSTPAAIPAVAPTATAPAGGNIFSSLFGGIFKLFGFADGTDFAPGGLAMVGERGRELVNLPRGSQVVPNHKLSAGSSAATGPRSVRHEYHITVGGNGDKELMARMRAAADETVRTGILAYDDALPDRIDAYNRNPEFRGSA